MDVWKYCKSCDLILTNRVNQLCWNCNKNYGNEEINKQVFDNNEYGSKGEVF